MKHLKFVYWLVFVFSLSALFLESFFYSGFLQKNFHLSFLQLSVLALLVSTGIAVWKHQQFTLRDSSSAFAITASAAVLSYLLYFAEATTYPNAVFSGLHIHPEIFRDIVVFLFSWTAISFIPLLLNKQKLAYFTFPLFTMVALFFARYVYEAQFPIIGAEDGVVEWLTCVFYLLAIPFSVWASIKSFVRKDFLSVIFCVAVTLGLLFLSGEEVSWGQRLAHIAVPEYFEEHNVQQELNLHNIDPVQKKMYLAYIAGGAWGSIGWAAWKQVPWKNISWREDYWEPSMFVPPWYVSSFFFSFLWYGIIRFLSGPVHYKTWEEVAELTFSIGVFLFTAVHKDSPLRKYFPSSDKKLRL